MQWSLKQSFDRTSSSQWFLYAFYSYKVCQKHKFVVTFCSWSNKSEYLTIEYLYFSFANNQLEVPPASPPPPLPPTPSSSSSGLLRLFVFILLWNCATSPFSLFQFSFCEKNPLDYSREGEQAMGRKERPVAWGREQTGFPYESIYK